jgi:hypothetical protein
MNLDRYRVIVFGSNNASYNRGSLNAIDNFVRRGGGVMFISDANFGSSWRDAADSDQPFLNRFGLIMNQDRGQFTLSRTARDYLAPTHPILSGVNNFDGEGISYIRTGTPPPGVRHQILVRAVGTTRNNDGTSASRQFKGSDRNVDSRDGAVVLATVDAGRVIGHMDRNTFFNTNGAGTNITRLDNRRYAENLFRFLAYGAADTTAPSIESNRGNINVVGSTQSVLVTYGFTESVARTLDLSDFQLTNRTTGRSIAINASSLVSYDTRTNTAVFDLRNTPLARGSYRLTLLSAGVTDVAGNRLTNGRTSTDFVI